MPSAPHHTTYIGSSGKRTCYVVNLNAELVSQNDALKKSFWSQIYRQNPLRENAKVMAQYEGRLILSLSICTTGSHKCELDGFSIRTKGALQSDPAKTANKAGEWILFHI
jgi:hypothetical protein